MTTTLSGTGITYGSGSEQQTAFSNNSWGLNTVVVGCYTAGNGSNYVYGTGTGIGGANLAADIMRNPGSNGYIARSPIGAPSGLNTGTGSAQYQSNTAVNNAATFRAVSTDVNYGVWYQVPNVGSWMALGPFGYSYATTPTGNWTITLWRRYA